MATLWTILAVLAGLQAPERAVLDLPAMVQRAPIIVLARVAQNSDHVVRNDAPFHRARRQLDVVSVLRGHVPQHLRVDERHHTLRTSALPAERYHGHLRREPARGETILAFLRPAGRGNYELAADSSLDSGDRASEVRALLRLKPVRR